MNFTKSIFFDFYFLSWPKTPFIWSLRRVLQECAVFLGLPVSMEKLIIFNKIGFIGLSCDFIRWQMHFETHCDNGFFFRRSSQLFWLRFVFFCVSLPTFDCACFFSRKRADKSIFNQFFEWQNLGENNKRMLFQYRIWHWNHKSVVCDQIEKKTSSNKQTNT